MTFRRIRFLLLSLFLVTGTLSAAKPVKKEKNLLSTLQKEPPAFLFSYFTGEGEDGLHLMYSLDGLFWRTINHGNTLLKSTLGDSKQMRDPSIVEDAEGTFHLVWTIGGSKNSIGYASSKDLINWSEQKEIPVMADEPTVRNAWAPEIYYDKFSRIFYIIWSSTIPGRFPEFGKTEDEFNHRLFYTTTKDFNTFAKTKLFYDPKFCVIDACILKRKGTFYMFLKNETKEPTEKNIRYVSSSNIKSFPTTVSDPISGKIWAEGPTAIQIGDYTYVYWDQYMNKRYSGARCNNLKKAEWEDISDMVRFPAGVRHGTAFKIDNKTLIKLQSLGKTAE